jgi:predicted nuclease with TOPRIM domain
VRRGTLGSVSSLVIVLLALVATSGCGGSDREELTLRLARLEGELAAIEERVDSFATVDDLHEEVARLERRLATAPTRAAAPAIPAKPIPGGPTPVPPGVGGFPDVPQLESLNELSAEYREKLAAIQERYADDPNARERLREIHELRSWFYDELRAANAAEKARRASGSEAIASE